MLRFNDILDRMLESQPDVDVALLQRAYVFSAKVHEGQERLSGEPYLVHPLEVAGLLVDMHADDVTVAAGLLHDTLEDTLTTRDELERSFGEPVAFLVEGLTKIAKLEFTSARERQAENFRKMLIAMSKDIRILLVKLADRLHNMRTLEHMREDSARRIAQETLDIYVPLAHRLGMQWVKRELEDLAFRTLHPDIAAELESQLAGRRDERERYIEEVIGVLSAKLAQAEVPAEVVGRVKDVASIHAKMEAQALSLDELYDVIAFRIVIEGSVAACYHALGLVHTTWRPVPTRFKDYIANPKPNGYQSLHTTVIGPYGERMEVQIRTREMHRDAELGIAAHWKYKAGRIDAGKDDAKFAWLRQLLEWQREIADPHEFLDAVKVDLFPDEVFVFTPRGEVMNLPVNATALDFAYAIHSDIGDHCSGARVNGRQVPLRHALHDGDTVEIQTSPTQFPRRDWLEFAVSSKARARIRHAIRHAQRERSREIGRGILESELKRRGLALARFEKGGQLAELTASTLKRGGSVADLYSAIAYGRQSAGPIATALEKTLGAAAAEPTPAPPAPAAPSRSLRSLFRRERRDADRPGVVVSGHPDVLVRFGGCCEPLRGDEVTGFVTRGRGVTVHTKDCPRIFELDPERRIEVDWDDGGDEMRKARVRILSRDRPGILAEISRSISAAGINIGSAKITTESGGPAVLEFELWVKGVGQLRDVLKQVEKVKGVQSAERVRT
ncbi:MAG: bifunctional (p)ppGpp synthetase/guanosine-3',5'-bis(diphosphate) 3'-pyrophosphohydrolase [Myxococcota bacterium]